MGTNYYFKIKAERRKEIEKNLTNLEKKLICLDPELHIGKASVGWAFIFQATPFYKNYKELLEFYENNKNYIEIINEYSKKVNIEEFKHFVESKKKGLHSQDSYLDDENNSFIETDFS